MEAPVHLPHSDSLCSRLTQSDHYFGSATSLTGVYAWQSWLFGLQMLCISVWKVLLTPFQRFFLGRDARFATAGSSRLLFSLSPLHCDDVRS